jgi:hypothetical protein
MTKKPKDNETPIGTWGDISGTNRFDYIQRGIEDDSSKLSPRATNNQIDFLNANGYSFAYGELSKRNAKVIIRLIKAAAKASNTTLNSI